MYNSEWRSESEKISYYPKYQSNKMELVFQDTGPKYTMHFFKACCNHMCNNYGTTLRRMAFYKRDHKLSPIGLLVVNQSFIKA